MKPPPFRYHDPTTVADAIDILASMDNAKLLAGGQSLMAMLNMRYVMPDHLIDLNGISALSYISESDGFVRIGAMTRQRDLELSPIIRARCPLMYEALASVGHRQTRNRGTIGGSLCHLDPAAELPAVATAYDAVIEARSQSGARDIPMAKFPAAFMTPAIQPDELVTGIRLRPWPEGHGGAFLEFSRRHGDFGLASIAVLLDVRERAVRRASVTVGGLAYAPIRAREAEDRLVGRPATEQVFAQAAHACGAFDATSDVHGSTAYRQHLARTLALRAITMAYDRAIRAQSERGA